MLSPNPPAATKALMELNGLPPNALTNKRKASQDPEYRGTSARKRRAPKTGTTTERPSAAPNPTSADTPTNPSIAPPSDPPTLTRTGQPHPPNPFTCACTHNCNLTTGNAALLPCGHWVHQFCVELSLLGAPHPCNPSPPDPAWILPCGCETTWEVFFTSQRGDRIVIIEPKLPRPKRWAIVVEGKGRKKGGKNGKKEEEGGKKEEKKKKKNGDKKTAREYERGDGSLEKKPAEERTAKRSEEEKGDEEKKLAKKPTKEKDEKEDKVESTKERAAKKVTTKDK